MDRWKRAEELFHAGMEQPPDRRLEFVCERCGDDPQLRDEVLALVRQAELADSLLDQSPVSKPTAALKRLGPGDKAGKFEVLSLIGSGGMGEVYRAYDVKLGREVALKVLPAIYANDTARLARLEREARAASALNHPHICTIHGLEEYADQPMIVMELVEGETLAARLARGSLSLERALALAIQLASALAAAHRKGIVHRDLKPANLMLTKSGVKVLDFGLAKLEQPLPGGSTVAQVTQEGQIMGTLQYMSPEQVQGADADARSDVFSFGLILYEMVSGKPAFRASNQASLIAAILDSEPEPITVAQGTGLERIVKRSLAKDPEDRWQSARDLMFELESIAEPQMPSAPPRRIWPWIAAAAVLCVLAALAGFLSDRWSHYATAGVRDWTFTILPPEGNGFPIGGSSATPEISPDGTMVAIHVGSQMGIRRLDSAQFITLRATGSAMQPFWSPDSKWLGFFVGAGTDIQPLMKVRVPDGAPERVANVDGHARGGSWNQKGDFLFATDHGLWISSGDQNGHAQLILPDEGKEGLSDPLWPHFLPDGEHFTFVALNPDRAADDEFSGNGIYLAGWSGGRWTEHPVLLKPNLNEASYSPAHGGCLLYLQNDNLYAQKLNVREARLEGSPELVLKGVASSWGGTANFSVSQKGPIAWRPGSAQLGQLTWFDRHGRVIGTTGPPAYYVDVALSPDERRIAATVAKDGVSEYRVMESGQSGFLRIASTSRNMDLSPFLLWAPDSEHIIYCMRQPGEPRETEWLMEQSISRSGEPVMVRQVLSDSLYALTANGKSVLTLDGARHLVLLPLAEGGKPVSPLKPTTTTFQAVLSPDGQWIAYESTGEILVERYPAAGDRRQISENGGRSPYWRGDGKEILYVGPKNVLFSVRVDPVRGVFGPPTSLFSIIGQAAVARSRSYAVTHDGSRILISKYVDQPGPHLVSIAADWEAELTKSSR